MKRLLIARAPVRISFGGGGTDLESYYTQFGGMVVSATIDHYVYTILSSNNHNSLEIDSADYSTFHRQPIYEDLIWEGDLSLPKAVVYHFGLKKGLNIFLASQVPPGTGLGSSGSVAVSMITALSAWCSWGLSTNEIAELACEIEIKKMGMSVGKQDQYASAFGGINSIIFIGENTTVIPLCIPDIEVLEKRLMLFFLGSTHSSSSILRHQDSATRAGEIINILHTMKELGMDTQLALEEGDFERFGELLDLSWQYKRTLVPGITNPFIDSCYAVAKGSGAKGGKLTGAGGGGFLMLYCAEDYQNAVTKALEGIGLKCMDFSFDFEGASVLYDSSI